MQVTAPGYRRLARVTGLTGPAQVPRGDHGKTEPLRTSTGPAVMLFGNRLRPFPDRGPASPADSELCHYK
jgi:hypothetical protein